MPQIQTLVKRLRTDDIAVQIEACRQLCDQLAEGENAPFGAIIAAGALPLLIQLVEASELVLRKVTRAPPQSNSSASTLRVSSWNS